MKKLSLPFFWYFFLFFFNVQLNAQCLNGTYTIGGNNPNFSFLSDAIDTLNTYGVCGPVLFLIRPGSYVSEEVISNFPGNSATNLVRFRSENGDSSSVNIIRPDGIIDWGLRLENAHHVSFEKLSFFVRAPIRNSSSFRSKCIQIDRGSSNISIKNCRFSNRIGSTIQYIREFIFIENGHRISIENCDFDRGDIGLRIDHSSGRTNNHISILNNRFFLQTDFCMRIARVNHLSVQGNDNWGSYSFYGSQSNFTNISENLFHGRVVLLGMGTLDQGSKNIFANNYCRQSQSSTNLQIGGIKNFQIVHNTFTANSNSNPTVTLFNSDSVNILNNLFAQKGREPLLRLDYDITGRAVQIDYNGYDHSTGFYVVNNGIFYRDFSSYQTTTGLDIHSLIDTIYFHPDGYHLLDTDSSNLDIFNKGIGLPYLNTDIDGEIRSPSMPDMGVDEASIIIPYFDLSISGINLSDTVCFGANDLYISLENHTDVDISKYKVFIAKDRILQDSFIVEDANAFDSPYFPLPAQSIVDSAIRRSIYIEPDTSSLFQVWVKDGNGFLDSLDFNDTLSFTLHSPPIPDLQLPEKVSFCQGDSVILNSSSGYISYEWATGDSSPQISIKKSGIYSLKVEYLPACFYEQSLFSKVKYIENDLWITNGETNSITGEGYKLYIGGSFSKVGPYQPQLGKFHLQEKTYKKFPSVFFEQGMRKHVSSIIPDGQGGWLIGGNFSRAGDYARNRLVHVDKDGNILPLNVQLNGEVLSLFLHNNQLFIGGRFDEIQGKKRVGIALLDLETGLVLDWDANFLQGYVTDMAIFQDALLISGDVLKEEGKGPAASRYNIFAVYPGSGRPHTGDIWPWLYSEFRYRSVFYEGRLIEVSGDTLVVAADSTRAYHLPSRERVYAEIGTEAMQIKNGKLYLASDASVRMLDLVTANVSTFVLLDDDNSLSRVDDIIVTDTSLILAGRFTIIGENSYSQIREFSLNNAQLTPLDVNLLADNPNEIIVNTIALMGDVLIVGGNFESLGGEKRQNLFEFDLLTNKATDWTPNPNGPVRVVKVDDERIYIGGSFEQISNQNVINLAVYDSQKQLIPAFSYPFTASSLTSRVSDFAFKDSSFFIGGVFDQLGGIGNQNLMEVKKSDGSILPFNPGVEDIVGKIDLLDTVLFVQGRIIRFNPNGLPIGATAGCNSNFAYVHADSANLIDCYYSDNLGPLNLVEYAEPIGGKLWMGGILQPQPYSLAPFYLAELQNLESVPFQEATFSPNDRVYSFSSDCKHVYLLGDFTEVDGNKEHVFAIGDLDNNVLYDQFNDPDRVEWFQTLGADIFTHKGKLYTNMDYSNLNALEEREGINQVDISCTPVWRSQSFNLDFTYQSNGNQIQFQNLSPDTSLDYGWIFGDGSASSDFSPSHTYALDGSYEVSLIASNACGADTISKQVQTGSLSVTPSNLNQEFYVYPNPSTGEINLEFELIKPSAYTFEIFDLKGVLQMKKEFSLSSGFQNLKLDLSQLPKGLYLISLKTQSMRFTERVLLFDSD